jgi:hypothetical protein
MAYFCKKTTELTDGELGQIKDLFNRIMERNADLEFVRRQYICNPLGYSYHSYFTNDEGEIVGINTYVPAYYLYKGKRLVIANAIDSMIDKPYRDFFTYNDITRNAGKFLKQEGVAFKFGFPNGNAFPLLMKAKLSKNMGRMHIYMLPYHVGGVKPSLRFLNPFSKLFCYIWVWCSTLFASKKVWTPLIEKEQTSFNTPRYQRFDSDYSHESIPSGGEFYYKVKEHEGVRTAFLVDVYPKSPRNFVYAVKFILKHEKRDFDLILYPGELGFGVSGLVKIPRRFEPKEFNMVGNIYDKEYVGEDILQIENWDVNLSNFDLI